MYLLNNHGRAAARHHKHGARLAHCLIIEVNTYYGIGAESTCTLGHLSKRIVFCLAQDALIRTAAASEEISYASKKILK